MERENLLNKTLFVYSTLKSKKDVAQTLFSLSKMFFINLRLGKGDFKTRLIGSNR
jgi:hypothetical protein